MINWHNELGQRTLQRIQTEPIIWLTTMSSSGFPQPRPVWFVWDNETFLIYSMPAAKKFQHIEQNPHVSLHFNSDVNGDDIQVILGNAAVDLNAPPTKMNTAYSEKYGEAIIGLGMDEESYSTAFSKALRIVPTRLRGVDPLPET